jgi:uncharacterized phage-like protein YoqJ
MKIAFTGHRPNKMGGYDDNTNLCNPTLDLIHDEILKLNAPMEFIVGMALGVDTWAAQYAIAFNIPFHAYVPFSGQETAWPAASRAKYHDILKKAASVKVICAGSYAAWKMQKRNEAMVNDCDILIAVWNGTSSGTANCVEYASKSGKNIITLFPGGSNDNNAHN